MTTRDFCYWLQGLFELVETKTLDEKQTQMIKNHLKIVFLVEANKGTKELQETLRKIHTFEEESRKNIKKDKRKVKKPFGLMTPTERKRFEEELNRVYKPIRHKEPLYC